MKIKRLEISNLFSFSENSKIIFSSKDDRILVTGQNEDDAGLDNNGSGKSSLLESICWILYKKTARDVFKNEVRRRENDVLTGFSSGEITLVDKDSEIKISRGIGDKEFLKIVVNGDDLTMKNETLTQEKIESIIGLSYEMFIVLNYFSREEVNVLCSGNSSDRMKFLERLLKLSIFERCLDEVKGDYRSIEDRIKEIKIKLDLLESEKDKMGVDDLNNLILDKETRLKALESEKRTLEKKRDLMSESKAQASRIEVVDSLRLEVEEIEEDVETAKESRKKIKVKINDAIKVEKSGKDKEELENLALELNKKIMSSTSEVSSVNASINLKKESSKKLEQIVGFKGGKCPLCMSIITKDKIKHISDEKDKLGREISELLEIKSSLLKSISRLEIEKQELEEDIKQWSDLSQNLRALKIELEQEEVNLLKLEERMSRKKKLYERELSKIQDGAKKFDQKEFDKVQALISNKEYEIVELKSSILYMKQKLGKFKEEESLRKRLSLEMTGLLEKKKIMSFWIEGFGKYGIPKMIVDKFIPTFENETNDVLLDLEFNIEVKFDTKIRRQTVKENYSSGFDIQVTNLSDLSSRKLETFSEGERKRIVISMMLGLRKVFGSDRSLDIILFDEVLDSLDLSGKERFIKLLDKIQGQKFIISHDREMEDLFRNKITVVKRNGISYVE